MVRAVTGESLQGGAEAHGRHGGILGEGRASRGEPDLLGDGREAQAGLAAMRDQDLVARDGALHVPAEAVAELVRRDRVAAGSDGAGVELVGLEPTTSAMPWRRSPS